MRPPKPKMYFKEYLKTQIGRGKLETMPRTGVLKEIGSKIDVI